MAVSTGLSAGLRESDSERPILLTRWSQLKDVDPTVWGGRVWVECGLRDSHSAAGGTAQEADAPLPVLSVGPTCPLGRSLL